MSSGAFFLPPWLFVKNDISNSNTLDNAADRHVTVFEVPKTGNIVAIGFATKGVTTSQSVDMRLETMSGGYNSGTLHGTNTYGTQASVAAGTYYEPAFVAAAAVTAGTTRAAVLQFTSTAGNLQSMDMDILPGSNMPYSIYNLTGASTKSTVRVMLVVLKYDDGSYYEVGCLPPLNAQTLSNAYNNASSPNERGNYISYAHARYVDRFWFGGNVPAGATADLVLYDSDGSTVLASVSITGDDTGQGSSGALSVYRFARVLLAANTYYRVTLKPTNTTNSTLWEFTFASAAIAQSIFPAGFDAQRTTRTGAGAWTETANVVSWIGLGVNEIVSGGGGRPEIRGSNL